MEEQKNNGREEIYSEKVKAGKRTYFFDVKSTRSNDYYLTITESKKRFNKDDEGFTYEKHKIFLYKEDFNKFLKGLTDAVDYVKTDLMPDFDFDAFNHDAAYEGEEGQANSNAAPSTSVNEASTSIPAAPVEATQPAIVEEAPKADVTPVDNGSTEEVDKW